jgi:hypothetical protein
MFTEDISAFYNVSELASTVTLNGVSVSAIFDNGYSAGAVGIMGVASTQPMLSIATSLVPASPVGKSAVVNGLAYTVAAHEPNGTGISALYLERTL